MKNNYSWAWKGIQKQLTFIKQHCKWRLGRGNKIKIWLDVWVPGMDTPPTPKQGVADSEHYIWVKDIFLQDISQWNSELLHHLFDSNVMDLILNMRIPTEAEDKLIWNLTHNGVFTLKSTYNRLHELSMGNLQTSNKIQNSTISWKKFWNIHTWPRVKHLWWKCLTDSLPTKVRLAINCRYIKCLCPLCNQFDESLMHILFNCPFSRAFWMHISGGVGILTGAHNSITVMFESWMIQPQHQSNHTVVLNTAMIVSCYIEKLNSSVSVTTNIGPLVRKVLPKWKPLAYPFYALNFDASYDATTGLTGIAIVVRDFAGRWRGWKFKRYAGIRSSEQAECLTFLDAIRWGIELRYTHIVFETDLQGIDSYINNSTPAVAWKNEDILLDAIDSLKNIPQ
ncbi:uncharacterized protein LOC113295355 [Papaver somniferum]|uniref:uncharacterized protein LOC113295355 n=1 Tax=Papaver somniferum TaxID=3469 RepID=UPI000E705CFB|nr:uncharacterized protein LOC113295355 [Papaver somniferum]